MKDSDVRVITVLKLKNLLLKKIMSIFLTLPFILHYLFTSEAKRLLNIDVCNFLMGSTGK